MIRGIPQVTTFDTPYPKEIDDAPFVNRLTRAEEVYQVGVCVPDTSALYEDEDIRNYALEKREATYPALPGGQRGYEPMLPLDSVRELELSAGGVKNVMIMTFRIGATLPPSNFQVQFGQVEVVANKDYRELGEMIAFGKYHDFARAASLIRSHLGYRAYGDHMGNSPDWPDDGAAGFWKRGSKTIESFMVGMNHLGGEALRAMPNPAGLYRVHDPRNRQMAELLKTTAAYFSATPGPHEGLRVPSYLRESSPLRRFDDWFNVAMQKKRFLGQAMTTQDVRAAHEHAESMNAGLAQARRGVEEARQAVAAA